MIRADMVTMGTLLCERTYNESQSHNQESKKKLTGNSAKFPSRQRLSAMAAEFGGEFELEVLRVDVAPRE